MRRPWVRHFNSIPRTLCTPPCGGCLPNMMAWPVPLRSAIVTLKMDSLLESCMPRSKAKGGPASTPLHYNLDDLRDAPEFHAYSRALGILTWGTWDHGERPFEERVKDFARAFPPDDPVRF